MAIGDYLPRRGSESSMKRYDDDYRSSPMSRFFDEVVSNFFSSYPENRLSSFQPRINVSDNEREIRVVAELPGMDEKDVDVTLTREGLLVRGEKREERRSGERNRCYECTYGSFERFIPLDTEVNEDAVKATFERGVLTVTVPKSEAAQARSRKVPIESAAGSRKATEREERSQTRPGETGSRGTQNGAHAGR